MPTLNENILKQIEASSNDEQMKKFLIELLINEQENYDIHRWKTKYKNIIDSHVAKKE